jgi:hypothetical protein
MPVRTEINEVWTWWIYNGLSPGEEKIEDKEKRNIKPIARAQTINFSFNIQGCVKHRDEAAPRKKFETVHVCNEFDNLYGHEHKI